MTENTTAWMTTGFGRTGDDRRYHTNRDCIALTHAKGVREATTYEVEHYELCTFCGPGVEQTTPDWGPQLALREAARND